MKINKVIQCDMETRALELRAQNKSLRQIAKSLSDEAKESISYGSVKNYFDAYDADKSRVAEKKDKLMEKVVEEEINTIVEVRTNIEELREISRLAKEAGDYRTAANALDKIYGGLEIINKMLGKYQTTPQVQFNFQEVNIDATRDKVVSRINGIAARIGKDRDTQ